MILEDMALFVAAVNSGSLSGGAKAVGISLSSASRHFGALEQRLGVRLALRTGRALVATDVGRQYFEAAKRLLSEVEDLEKAIGEETTKPSGLLRVTGPTLFGRAFLLPLTGAFLQAYSAISLDLILVDREVNLIDENIHVAIRVGEVSSQGLIARRLGGIRWAFCGSPKYLAMKKGPETLCDLGEHDCLIFSRDGMASKWIIPTDAGTRNIGGRVRLRANTIEAVIDSAKAGCGITWVPAWAAQAHIKSGELVEVLSGCPPTIRPVFAVFTHHNMLADKVRVFIDFTAERICRSFEP